ncbi:GDSL esterase/lipase 2-like isoform X2 [Euphorbia lathyris]|uniref:GDSL esterase/lipase 2-like isoform X2 n=1 Tax=Euphorbia lathyris TaxID=212925 RepID=UPI0033141B3E
METSRSHLCLLVFCFIIAQTSCVHQGSLKKNHIALFIFGDSLFDVGNNNYLNHPIALANFTPYGTTYFHYPSGRFSNGRLIPDFIAEKMKLPLIPPYLLPGYHEFTNGANFASAGAGALLETHLGDKGMVVDLNTQMVQMKNVKKEIRKQIGDAQTCKLLSKAIYLINIGANDYLGPSPVFNSFSQKDYVAMVLGNLTSVVKDIYKIGGRKFGFIGVGAFDCSPSMRALEQNKGGCNEVLSSLTKLHNEALPKILKEMQSQLKEFQYSYFDFYTTFSERITNPLKYGFKEAKVACCGAGPYRGIVSSCGLVKGYEVCEDVNEYVFFDSVHPTEKFYDQLSHLIWSGGHNVNIPYNLKTLVCAN